MSNINKMSDKDKKRILNLHKNAIKNDNLKKEKLKGGPKITDEKKKDEKK